MGTVDDQWPRSGTVNSVAVSGGFPVKPGQTWWLAALASNGDGKLVLRGSSGAYPLLSNQYQRSLTSLPPSWSPSTGSAVGVFGLAGN